MEKIIAAKTSRGVKIAKLSTDIQDSLNMRLFISQDEAPDSNVAIYEFSKKFNQIIWDVKLERVFPNIDNYEGEEKKQYIRESLEKCFNQEIENIDLPFTEVYGVDNLKRHFRNEAFIKLQQVEAFNGMPIPDKTKEFIGGYVETIDEVNFTESQLKSIYTQFAEPVKEVEEYVMYIGENDKYKGCVGRIVDVREDKAPHLVEFRNVQGKTCRYWSKEENIVRFYI